MELERAGDTTQPGRVPLSASTRHQPITDAWGTLSLPHNPPQAAPWPASTWAGCRSTSSSAAQPHTEQRK